MKTRSERKYQANRNKNSKPKDPIATLTMGEFSYSSDSMNILEIRRVDLDDEDQRNNIFDNLERNRTLQKVKLERLGLDDTDVNNLAGFVRENHNLKELIVIDDTLAGSHILSLLLAINNEQSVRVCCILTSVQLRFEEEEDIVKAVEENETLRELNVNIRDQQLLQRLKKRLDENERRWIIPCPLGGRMEILLPRQVCETCRRCTIL